MKGEEKLLPRSLDHLQTSTGKPGLQDRVDYWTELVVELRVRELKDVPEDVREQVAEALRRAQRNEQGNENEKALLVA